MALSEKLFAKANLAHEKALQKLNEYHALLGVERGYRESAKDAAESETSARKRPAKKKVRRKKATK